MSLVEFFATLISLLTRMAKYYFPADQLLKWILFSIPNICDLYNLEIYFEESGHLFSPLNTKFSVGIK